MGAPYIYIYIYIYDISRLRVHLLTESQFARPIMHPPGPSIHYRPLRKRTSSLV